MRELLSNAIRQKGREFVQNEQVAVTTRQHLGDTAAEVQGKVFCSFGFVHHPRINVVELRDANVVTDYTCDCYEGSGASGFCSHCAALAIAAYGDDREIIYEKHSGQGAAAGTGRLFQSIPMEQVQIEEDRQEASGRYAAARVFCDFGFVHHPRLHILGSDEIADYSCDCYEYAASKGMCAHCQALLCKLKQTDGAEEGPDTEAASDTEETPTEEPEPTPEDPLQSAPVTEADWFAAEEAAAPPEEEPAPLQEENDSSDVPRSMQILLGESTETQEPVYWCPNDTEQVFHTNMGIIGTMGTGKTQFTKSLVTQLYRQQHNNFDGQRLGILIFDYKGDYNESKPDFVRDTHARILKAYRLPFNPFSLTEIRPKPQLPIHIANTFTDTIAKIYGLGPKQSASLLRCIIQAYQNCGIAPGDPATWKRPAPTFSQVYDVYCANDDIKKNDSLYAVMEKLFQFQIFEDSPERTKSLFALLNGVVVLDLSGYDADIQNLIVAITLDLFYSQMQNSGSSRMDERYRQLKKLILVDEADNFMSQNFPALKKILKEGREFGVGTILSTQFLTHFGTGSDDYSKYILTWAVHNVADLKRSDVEFVFQTDAVPAETERIFHQIKALEKHQSIVKIGNAPLISIQDMPFWKLVSDPQN
ncbi:MAG: DUF87 domain-containing protein [Clostridiales bacterium]|nr:DUF87 domain-containing protein [Clostridiales bacterium]